jgi:long-chain acyl-CoA synthetase
MLLEQLTRLYDANPRPVIVDGGTSLNFADVLAADGVDLSGVQSGEVVAVVGDYSAENISTLIRLIDRKAVIVPLCRDMAGNFPYFFESAGVDWVVRDGRIERLRAAPMAHPLLDQLRAAHHSGLILFSSGTTGQPKAILHDFDRFLARYGVRRPPLRTMSFLVFDHIGGLNTLFHTLFNQGLIVVPSGRTPTLVLDDVERHGIEVLPATPTFLRMLMMSGLLETRPEALRSLRTVTYSTEPMDQTTLDHVCAALPDVEVRQTYGMSELGAMRVKSRARDSLWISVDGDGVETRVDEHGVLLIRSTERMLGYLNAAEPFTDGWYDTGDIVETDGPWLRIVGRSRQIINVAGIKVLPTEVERVALLHPDIVRAKAEGVRNPITGQHVEVTCELAEGAATGKVELRNHFAAHLQEAVRPHRIRIGAVAVNHRFKKV